jgi:hypothetical protein
MLNLSSQKHECPSAAQKGQVASSASQGKGWQGMSYGSVVTAFTENVVPMSRPE